MDYTDLKKFKMRYFILFAVFLFIASIVLVFAVDFPESEQWITFIMSMCLLLYIVYQTNKWNFMYDSYSDRMAKKLQAKDNC